MHFLHLSLNPLGWGIMAVAGGAWLLKKSGKSLPEALGTVAGATTAVAKKSAEVVGIKKTAKS